MKRRHSLLENAESANFITTTVVNFLPIFTNNAIAKIVLDSIKVYSDKYCIQIHGFVIMPNHIHMLVTGEKQRIVSQFMSRLKEYSAKSIIDWCIKNNEYGFLTQFSAAATESKEGHKYQVWQKRFDNVAITRNKDLLVKLNYIHNNPVQERWGLCDKPEDYVFSSARFYINCDDVGIPVTKLI